ncbi:MAG: Mur ligase domain-containing protein, partial [Anaerolineae bacterium]|nr:Mur ligase domain-containing protein [Anaerolineae bacterium]
MSDTSNLITLADILEALCENRPDGVSLPITGAVVDSRQAFPGCLFVALQGERADGHDYIGDAFQRGAVLALVQRQASQEFPLVDLRRGLPPQAIPAGQSPLCLQVTDSLQALQQIAR